MGSESRNGIEEERRVGPFAKLVTSSRAVLLLNMINAKKQHCP